LQYLRINKPEVNGMMDNGYYPMAEKIIQRTASKKR